MSTIVVLILSGCSAIQSPHAPHDTELKTPAACHIVYDAGSSGTRLYIYQQQGTGWLEHSGPKTSALADPVREIRGMTWQDRDAVIHAMMNALEDIRRPGPNDQQGRARWPAFDWQTQCRLLSASIYATAGMRIAEQENRRRSRQLWQQLEQRLAAEVGPGVAINVRTLTGYEEGLFAWLAVREQKRHEHFGILEMGGASAQITFPCPDCDTGDDALKSITLNGRLQKIYSYSFLGLGQRDVCSLMRYLLPDHAPCWPP